MEEETTTIPSPTTTTSTSTSTTTIATTTSTTMTTTTTAETTTNRTEKFTWGKNNWSFDNTEGYFGSGKTFRQMLTQPYLDKLKESLTKSEYQDVFEGYVDPLYGYVNAWIDDEWYGSCYGMSALMLLSYHGIVPYDAYTAGASSLYDLESPIDNQEVCSLVTYYHLLQIKDVIQQYCDRTPTKSDSENISDIIDALDQYGVVLIGLQKDDWAHAVLAYGYSYGSWTKNGSYNIHLDSRKSNAHHRKKEA